MSMKLNAEQIPALSDGLVGRMIDQALKTAAADLDDRGDDGHPRKVTIELTMTKEPKTNNATILTDVKVKVPNYKSPKTQAVLSGENGSANIKFESSEPVLIHDEN